MMSVFKCKMCGGALEIKNNETVASCEYCGTKQTLPRLDNDKKMALYDRANHFRRNDEFDKAMNLYEQILNEDKTDAESYWSIVLCRYGIEYVEDPDSRKRIPTVNRVQYTSIFDDEDYKSALQYADSCQREIYENEAKAINEIQKGFLAISQEEEPFDVFICYKETDYQGRRTPDSVLAQELYFELLEEGFKVFFSRITLEDKLGCEYEPYIFAALNSAKVMVVLGTKPEYFNAVWVKNEWSRYLALIKNGADKMLIPAYRDMDPYDLPEEFSHLQAQDMSKLGFMQDLVRGIKKIVDDRPSQEIVAEQVSGNAGNVTSGNVTTESLLERAFIFLEDSDWHSADEYCEKVLDAEPKNAMAYLGKLMAELKVNRRESLKECAEPFDDRNNYEKILRFADDTMAKELKGVNVFIKERNEERRKNDIYQDALRMMQTAQDEDEFEKASRCFGLVPGYKEADEHKKTCSDKAVVKRLERQRIEEENRLERERRAELARIEAEKQAEYYKKIAKIVAPIVAVIIVFLIILNNVIIPNNKYNEALALMEKGKYEESIDLFAEMDGYKESKEKIAACKTALKEKQYKKATKLMNSEQYQKAIAAFEEILDYQDSKSLMYECTYRLAQGAMAKEEYDVAISTFEEISDYKDSQALITECKYKSAVKLMQAGEYQKAIAAFGRISDYQDSQALATECKYLMATSLLQSGKTGQAMSVLNGILDYKDTRSLIQQQRDKFKACISASCYYTIGLKSDGTVVCKGTDVDGMGNASTWTGITAVSAGSYYSAFGLKNDGTVVAVGGSMYGENNVSGWRNIVAISAGGNHTVGLRSDGTVVAVGSNEYGQCNVSGWRNIVAISAGSNHTVGLRSDGTVVAVGNKSFGECNVSSWRNIVAISAGVFSTVGLKSDGTVVAVGQDIYERNNVSGWTDIVAIYAGSEHTVGLKSDGTVVAVGNNNDGQCNVSRWTNVVAIAAGLKHTVALKSDGTVVAVGKDEYGECGLYNWDLFE